MENIRRYVLFGAMAVVSYLLLQQWNEDYGQAQPRAQELIEEQELSSSVAPRVEETVSTNSESAVPTVESTDAPSSHFTGKLIEVKTDEFDIKIDPYGGDIVYAALPKYPYSVDQPDVPFVILEKNRRASYVAQGDFYGDSVKYHSGDRTQYSANAESFQMSGDELRVVLSTNVEGIVYNKIYTFNRGEYLINVTYQIQNETAEAWQGRVFGQLKRDTSPDPSSGGGIGMSSYLGYAWTTPESRYEKVSFNKIEDEEFKMTQVGGWVSLLQHYFLTAWVPDQDAKQHYFLRPNKSGDEFIGGFHSQQERVLPGETRSVTANLYIGPKLQEDLAVIAPHLELTVDYGWLWFIAQPLFWLLTTIHGLIGNWGWSIILLTVLIKAIFYPLTAASYRSMAKMKKFAPKMTQLREQFGDDRQKLSQEMMKLYQKEKINPMGGCLPMLVQMPVFIALYWTLMEAVELRQSPFMFWIVDLSIKDPTFILPLLMGVSMFFQMQLGAQPQDPTQAKIMKFMPVIFTVMFLWFPSGLVLYWLVNNCLSISQQWYINKQIEKADAKKA